MSPWTKSHMFSWLVRMLDGLAERVAPEASLFTCCGAFQRTATTLSANLLAACLLRSDSSRGPVRFGIPMEKVRFLVSAEGLRRRAPSPRGQERGLTRECRVVQKVR